MTRGAKSESESCHRPTDPTGSKLLGFGLIEPTDNCRQRLLSNDNDDDSGSNCNGNSNYNDDDDYYQPTDSNIIMMVDE